MADWLRLPAEVYLTTCASCGGRVYLTSLGSVLLVVEPDPTVLSDGGRRAYRVHPCSPPSPPRPRPRRAAPDHRRPPSAN